MDDSISRILRILQENQDKLRDQSLPNKIAELEIIVRQRKETNSLDTNTIDKICEDLIYIMYLHNQITMELNDIISACEDWKENNGSIEACNNILQKQKKTKDSYQHLLEKINEIYNAL